MRYTLPQSCTFRHLLDGLNAAGLLAPEGFDRLHLTVPNPCWIEPDAIAYLACLLKLWKDYFQCWVSVDGNRDVVRYLARMDFHRAVEIPAPPVRRAPDAGRLLPLRLVHDADSGIEAVRNLCDLLVRHYDDAHRFIPALEWAVWEVVDNINIHSDSPQPGAICAQYYPNKHRIVIGVVDIGLGIPRTLQSAYPELKSDADAITAALRRGVTRDQKVGQGNGLAGMATVLEANRGDFSLWSNTALVEVRSKSRRTYTTPRTHGTAVRLDFRTDISVDLESTWIGDPGFTYFDAEVGRLETEPILIRDECVSTGTRPHARPLRTKIENLIPDIENPIVLDFSGVETASSSFLDELLGRLAASLGEDDFKEMIVVSNAPPLVRRLASVVIDQRINGLDNSWFR